MSTPANSNSDSGIESFPNVNSGSTSSNSPSPPILCLIQLSGYCTFGALIGSISGYSYGLITNKGLQGSLEDAASYAKSFAFSSGVHSLVDCFLKRLRGKDDVINAGISGCCAGLAINFQGTPQEMLQNCFAFGAISFIVKGISEQQPALAEPFSSNRQHYSVLPPPLALPLPDELKESFSSFWKLITK